MRALRWALSLGLIAAVLWALRGQWPAAAAALSAGHYRWGPIALGSLLVLAAYAVLIQCWRTVLRELGGQLSFGDAALVWLGSNVARYVPGSLWQLGVMSVMSRRRGVAIAGAGAAAVLVTIVSVFTGLALFAATAARAPTLGARGVWVLAAGMLLLATALFLLPPLTRLASRVTGRSLVLPRVGHRAVGLAAAGSLAAWILYGLAFWLLLLGVLEGAPRSLTGAVALYTGSYLAGFLALLPPAGLGAAEGAMYLLAPQLGVMTGPEAAAVALIVRLWRTALELLPGVLALLLDAARPDSRDRAAPVP